MNISIANIDEMSKVYWNIDCSFFNLEINLYTTNEFDFKSVEIKNSVKNIVQSIFNNNITTNKYFEFSTTKKEESL